MKPILNGLAKIAAFNTVTWQTAVAKRDPVQKGELLAKLKQMLIRYRNRSRKAAGVCLLRKP